MKEDLRNKGIKRTQSFYWPKNSEESSPYRSLQKKTPNTVCTSLKDSTKRPKKLKTEH